RLTSSSGEDNSAFVHWKVFVTGTSHGQPITGGRVKGIIDGGSGRDRIQLYVILTEHRTTICFDALRPPDALVSAASAQTHYGVLSNGIGIQVFPNESQVVHVQ